MEATPIDIAEPRRESIEIKEPLLYKWRGIARDNKRLHEAARSYYKGLADASMISAVVLGSTGGLMNILLGVIDPNLEAAINIGQIVLGVTGLVSAGIVSVANQLGWAQKNDIATDVICYDPERVDVLPCGVFADESVTRPAVECQNRLPLQLQKRLASLIVGNVNGSVVGFHGSVDSVRSLDGRWRGCIARVAACVDNVWSLGGCRLLVCITHLYVDTEFVQFRKIARASPLVVLV